MHGTVRTFIQKMSEKYPNHFDRGNRVVELGSHDINGSPREYFKYPSEYVGIDYHGGKGVDVVGVAHEWKPAKADYDVVVSTEMLEHDPYWEKTLAHASNILRSGGILLFTCAAPPRPAHHLHDSPEDGYYGNRSTEDVLGVLQASCDWLEIHAQYERKGLDLVFWGVKA
jgi:SAM-dependent methyltransferase